MIKDFDYEFDKYLEFFSTSHKKTIISIFLTIYFDIY